MKAQRQPSSLAASLILRGVPIMPKYRRRFSPKRGFGQILSYMLVLPVVALYLLPMLYLVNISLKTPTGFILDPIGLTKTWSWQNYAQAWQAGDFGTGMVNSLLYAITSSVISTALSLLLAFPIARHHVKFARFWYLFFVITLFLPSALIPQFQLMVRIGLYDTQVGYILLQSAALGLGPFLIVGYLRSVPVELDEAAMIDGCGYYRYLWTIITPLILPILITTFLLHVISVWNDIIGPTIYLSDPRYQPLTLGLFAFYGQYGNEWAKLSAATLIVAFPPLILYIALQRYFINGALGGAFKG